MINKDIYGKALELRDLLKKDFHGMSQDLVICYILIQAIDEIKKQLTVSYQIESTAGFVLDADQTLDRLCEMTSDLNKK